MKAAVAGTLLVAIAIFGSMFALAAGGDAATPGDSNLSGKYIILDVRGRNRLGVLENVRFDSIGKRDFVVVPLKHKESQRPFEYWAPVDDVTAMMVFASHEDATAYDTMATMRQRAARSNPGNSNDQTDEP